MLGGTGMSNSVSVLPFKQCASHHGIPISYIKSNRDIVARDAPSTMQSPTPKSLHRLSIDNPWFAVHPLLWTSQHLRLLHCYFQHLDSVITTSSSPSSVADKDLTLHSRRLAKIRSPIVKSISVGHLLCHQGSPLEKLDGSHAFLFAGRSVQIPECHIFRVHATDIQQRPIVGYYHYDNVARERQRAMTARSHPNGSYNLPVARIYQRRLRNVAPALWFEDPYLVCILLSLAQLQRRRSQLPRPKTFNVSPSLYLPPLIPLTFLRHGCL